MKMKLNLRAYFAEVLGTFLLTFIIIISLNKGVGFQTPLLAAATLGLSVYLLGGISGAHLNPAVTVGLFFIRKIDLGNTFVYIFSQILGALIAMFLASIFIGAQLVAPAADNSLAIFFAELLGTMVLTFGVASVVLGKVDDDMSGIVIGSSLFIGIMIASVASNGILNPTVALGIESISASYLFGPILGGIVGTTLAKILNK